MTKLGRLNIFSLFIILLLLNSGCGDKVERAVAKLNSDDYSVRLAAVGELGQSKDIRAIAPLIKALGDSNSNILAEAKGALKVFGLGAPDSLYKALQTASGEQYREIVFTLGEIGDIRAIDYLVLLQDSIHIKTANRLFRKFQKDLPSEQMTKSFNQNALNRNTVFDSTDVDSLIASVSTLNNPGAMRAIEALGKIKDSRIVPALIGFINDTNSFYKDDYLFNARYTIDAFGLQKDTSSVVPIIELLKRCIDAGNAGKKPDDKHNINYLCSPIILVLGQIGDARAVEPIKEIFFNDARLQKYCASSLGSIAAPDAVEALIKAAESPNPKLKESGITGLMHANTPAGMQELIRQLEYISYMCTKPCEGSQPEIMIKKIEDTGWKPSTEKEKFYWNVLCSNYDSINANLDDNMKYLDNDLKSDFYYKKTGAERVLKELTNY